MLPARGLLLAAFLVAALAAAALAGEPGKLLWLGETVYGFQWQPDAGIFGCAPSYSALEVAGFSVCIPVVSGSTYMCPPLHVLDGEYCRPVAAIPPGYFADPAGNLAPCLEMEPDVPDFRYMDAECESHLDENNEFSLIFTRCPVGHVPRDGQCMFAYCQSVQDCHGRVAGCLSCPEGRLLTRQGFCIESGMCKKADRQYCLEFDINRLPYDDIPMGYACPEPGPGELMARRAIDPPASMASDIVTDNPHCLTAIGPFSFHCLTCRLGMSLVPTDDPTEAGGQPVGRCLERCPAGRFLNAQGICQACPSNCARCEEPTRCLQCLRSHFLMDGVCQGTQPDCPPGTAYELVPGRCTACGNPHCSECMDNFPDVCLACEPGHILAGGDCLPANGGCEPGFRLNEASPSMPAGTLCVACPIGCDTCQNSGSCVVCSRGFALSPASDNSNFMQCVHAGCPFGHFRLPDAPAGSPCLPCNSSCHGCNPDTGSCLSCKSSFLLAEVADGTSASGTPPPPATPHMDCLETCPPGTGPLMGRCRPCQDAGCGDCHLSSAFCMVCAAGFVHSPDRESCMTACPGGHFPETVALPSGSDLHYCSACPASCVSCSGPSFDQCTACQASRLFVASPSASSTAATTLSLDPPQDALSTTVTGHCAWECPGLGFFETGSLCLKCPDDCRECTWAGDGPTGQPTAAPLDSPPRLKCTRCAINFLHAGACVAACPMDTYSYNATCLPCHEDCISCDGPLRQDCRIYTDELSSSSSLIIALMVTIIILLIVAVVVGVAFAMLRWWRRQHLRQTEAHKLGMDGYSMADSGTSGSDSQLDQEMTVLNTDLELSLPGSVCLDFVDDIRIVDQFGRQVDLDQQEEEEEDPTVAAAAGDPLPEPVSLDPTSKKILDNLELSGIKPLGRGGQARIYSCHVLNEPINQRFNVDQAVVKIFNVPGPNAPAKAAIQARVQRNNEIAIMWALSDKPGIARMIGYCMTPPCLVMQYYTSDLRTLIRDSKTRLNEQLILSLSLQIVAGVHTIHAAGIAHCDLKPSNIFLGSTVGGDPSAIRAFIGDFGVARNINVPSALTIEDRAGVHGLSARYAAPELLIAHRKRIMVEEEARRPADIYALGMLLSELLTRRPSWKGVPPRALFERVLSGERPPLLPLQSDLELSSKLIGQLASVVDQAWDAWPDRRPSADQILNHLRMISRPEWMANLAGQMSGPGH